MDGNTRSRYVGIPPSSAPSLSDDYDHDDDNLDSVPSDSGSAQDTEQDDDYPDETESIDATTEGFHTEEPETDADMDLDADMDVDVGENTEDEFVGEDHEDDEDEDEDEDAEIDLNMGLEFDDDFQNALLDDADRLDFRQFFFLERPGALWGPRHASPFMEHQAPAARDDPAVRPRHHGDQLVQLEVGRQANAAARDGQRRPAQQPDIIDLTGDDDDPEPPARQPSFNRSFEPVRAESQRPSENQRRRPLNSQNPPPRLNRSDGSYVNDEQVIVLSSSDEEDEPVGEGSRRNRSTSANNNPTLHHLDNNAGRSARNARVGNQSRRPGFASAQTANNGNTNNHHNHRHHHHHHHHHHNNNNHNIGNNNNDAFRGPFNQLPFFQFLTARANNFMQPFMAAERPMNFSDDDLVITGARNVHDDGAHAGVPGGRVHPAARIPAAARNAIGRLPAIQLDYVAHPFRQVPLPEVVGPRKPPHVPPPAARPGFTRDTGDDVVAICPSCDQELAYDPDGDDETAATPAKKSRAKKATAEHHFWAVKACGHVYCKRCFDNRRPTAKSTVQVGFRTDTAGGKKLFCAVEDCESDVSPKSAWIGIFM